MYEHAIVLLMYHVFIITENFKLKTLVLNEFNQMLIHLENFEALKRSSQINSCH